MTPEGRDPVAGLRETRRVARRVVVLTFDASEDVLHRRFWLTRDYLPEFAGLFTGWPSLAGRGRGRPACGAPPRPG